MYIYIDICVCVNNYWSNINIKFKQLINNILKLGVYTQSIFIYMDIAQVKTKILIS